MHRIPIILSGHDSLKDEVIYNVGILHVHVCPCRIIMLLGHVK